MVEAIGAGRANVHAWAAAHRLESFEDSNIRCTVATVFNRLFFLVLSHRIEESPRGTYPCILANMTPKWKGVESEKMA